VEKAPVLECRLNFPVIVKPAQQDASVGVDQASVATDLEGLNRRVNYLLEQFGGTVLVEEFIFGREVTVALVEMPELRLLPATEAVFPDAGPGYWPILSYDAKWTESSAEYVTTDYHFHAQMTPELATLVETTAKRAFRLLGCRDYARVDFRIRASDDQPFVLELNPNPDFAPDRALANNLWAAGLNHADFTLQLVRNALGRAGAARPGRYRDQREAS
jgi:D-alanine-D-alanine ligase